MQLPDILVTLTARPIKQLPGICPVSGAVLYLIVQWSHVSVGLRARSELWLVKFLIN